MKQVWALSFALGLVLVSGCGSNGQNAPDKLPRANAPEAAAKSYAPADGDVEALTTIPVYPGAKVDTKEKEVSANLSPDETRYHVVLSTTDGIAKVRAFYEKSLDAKAQADSKGFNIWTRTARGNDVKLLLSADGKSTKVDFVAIVYKH